MRIDPTVEPLVRQALYAAIKADVNMLDDALKAFPDEQSRRAGLDLTVAIAVAALVDAHGRKPTDEEVGSAANVVAEVSDWYGVTALEAYRFLGAAIEGRDLTTVLEPEKVIPYAFVIAAGILGTSRNLKEGEWWFDLLDRIEAQLEATPD